MATKEQLDWQAREEAGALTIASLIASKYGATIEFTEDLTGFNNHTLNFIGNRPGTSAQLAREIADKLGRYIN